MKRPQLCSLLGLPDDASVPMIRARVARVATGKPELGSSPAKRAALVEALLLAPGCSDLACLRVVESIINVHARHRRATVTSILSPTHRRTSA